MRFDSLVAILLSLSPLVSAYPLPDPHYGVVRRCIVGGQDHSAYRACVGPGALRRRSVIDSVGDALGSAVSATSDAARSVASGIQYVGGGVKKGYDGTKNVVSKGYEMTS